MSGGLGPDFTQQPRLTQYRPDLMHLPITNSERCTGSGIKMGKGTRCKVIVLKWVQVHPTVLVKPDDTDAKTDFAGAEMLLASVALS